MKKLITLLTFIFIFTNLFGQNSSGFYHNEILKAVFEQPNANEILKNKNLLRSFMVTELTSINPSIFNETEIIDAFNQGDNFIQNLPIDLSNFNEVETNKVIYYLLNNNKISPSLAYTLNSVYHSVYNPFSTVESVLDEVRDINTSSMNISDKKYAEIFKDIFLSSYEFWSGNDDNGTIMAFSWKDLALIGADAAGGLIGMGAGPAGTIIIGAQLSAYWVVLNIEI